MGSDKEKSVLKKSMEEIRRLSDRSRMYTQHLRNQFIQSCYGFFLFITKSLRLTAA